MPGKIWNAAGKVYIGSKEGLKTQALGVTSFFELSMTIIAQASLTLFFGVLVFRETIFASTTMVVLLSVGINLACYKKTIIFNF